MAMALLQRARRKIPCHRLNFHLAGSCAQNAVVGLCGCQAGRYHCEAARLTETSCEAARLAGTGCEAARLADANREAARLADTGCQAARLAEISVHS